MLMLERLKLTNTISDIMIVLCLNNNMQRIQYVYAGTAY